MFFSRETSPNRVFYLVKWIGLPYTECSWETEAECPVPDFSSFVESYQQHLRTMAEVHSKRKHLRDSSLFQNYQMSKRPKNVGHFLFWKNNCKLNCFSPEPSRKFLLNFAHSEGITKRTEIFLVFWYKFSAFHQKG